MADIAHQRLFNQRIDGKRFEKPEEVVRWMGALQAQDYYQSLWAIGLRTQCSTTADIEQAVEDHKIVRTWPMRGTIHFVPSEDAKWMVQLSAARMIAADARRQRQLELDEKILERCKVLFYEALCGGKRLSRPEMMRVLEDAGISPQGQRGYHILWYTSQIGLICQGPMAGKQQTFVLLDEWAPNSKEISREESLAELARRYFPSHGPATVHDFAWWGGLTVTEARSGLEAVKPELISEKINGKDYWMAAPDGSTYEQSRAYLLPSFDEYLLGYRDRSAVLVEEHVQKVVPGKNGMFLSIIVVDGQVVGTWKRTLKKKAVEITFNPFYNLAAEDAGLTEAAHRYCEFVGLPVTS
jgi:hypothetical protein